MRGKKIGFALLLCLAGMGSALAQAKLTPQQENVLKSMVDATAEAYMGGTRPRFVITVVQGR